MILLDTNVLSELMRPAPNQAVVAWLDTQVASDVFYCALSRAEIELGIALLPDSRRKRPLASAAHAMFEQFDGRCLPFGEVAAMDYARIVSTRMRAGRPVSTEDAQIAAIARAHGLMLATRNIKDFSDIPDLRLIDPWQTEIR